MKLPLGGKEQNYDSKKSRERLINMIAEINKDGSYRTVKRLEGLTDYVDFGTGAIRSNLLTNDGFIYAVSGSVLHRVGANKVTTNLGTVGGSGRAQILENSVPGDSQIFILNGSGDGYVYNNANGLVKVTDLDFLSTISGTILDERFWFARTDTNELFASEISTGLSYDPLSFISAEEKPDKLVAVIAMKSAIWGLSKKTVQYFQSFDNTTVPLRPVKGYSQQRGISALRSLAEIGDQFAWLADDGTVRMISDTSMETISDLELELKIKGNDSAEFPGFTKTDDAIGFFVDGPVHKIYYLIFPSEGYVWGYDLITKSTHSRESENLDVWRINSATIFDNKIIVGDSIEGKLWILDPSAKTEGDEILRATITTPTVTWTQDVSIPLIELDMEVGTTTDPDANPMMMVSYTKDGRIYHNHSRISLGEVGQGNVRVPIRMFGRIVRNQPFGLRLEFTEPEKFQLYGADMIVEGGY